MSEVAVALLAAAAALSAVEFVGGPLRFRVLANQYAVRGWLLDGIVHWSSKTPPRRWLDRIALALASSGASRRVQRIVKADFATLFDVGRSAKQASVPMGRLDRRLVTLATGSRGRSMYRLEADQLAAQVSAAAERALDRPERDTMLLISLARLTLEDVKRDQTLGGFLRAVRIDSQDPRSQFALTRRDLAFRIQRRLDDLQIKTRSVQEIGDHVGFVVLATLATRYLLKDPYGTVPWYVLGPIAGFLSPLMRRIVKAIGR